MAESIDLLFTVADSSKNDILATFQTLQSEINSRYGQITFKVNPKSITELERAANILNSNSRGNTAATVAEVERVATAYTQAADAARTLHQEEAREATAVDTRTKLNRLLIQMENYSSKYGASLSKNITLQSRLNQLMTNVRAGTMMPAEAAREFTQLRVDIRSAGLEVETLGQKFKKLFGTGLTQRFKTIFSMAAFRGIYSLYQNIKDIDSAMTELKKVTHETDQAYQKFMDNAASRAKNIGSTMSDVIQATAELARVGYGMQDASKLADAAIVLKNVGDGITDATDAAQKIISVVKAFPEFESNAMAVVDKMNEVGNTQAISSSGIAEALQRSAGALMAANNTLDESIALAVGMNAVTQNPEKVGTSLKTLSMYLRAAKTEAEEAGESTDGMAESVSKLRDEILALTGQKVDIMANADEFKSTIQIMRELAAVWDQLSDINQANLLERIGGKRNASVVASLLTNFDDVEEALKSAQNSEGSALKENEKYLDSINGRLEVLKATWQSISSEILQSGAVKGFLQIAQVIGNITDGLIRFNGALPTVGMAAGLIAIVKNLD